MTDDISTQVKTTRTKVQVTECSVLVPLSKKLAHLVSQKQPPPELESIPQCGAEQPVALKPEVNQELMRARKLIDDNIRRIRSNYPVAKQNKLFNLRFGSEDAIKTMTISHVFKKLEIVSGSIKTHLIADLNYYGQPVAKTAAGHSHRLSLK